MERSIARRLCAACLHVIVPLPSCRAVFAGVFRRLLCDACVARWYVKSHRHSIKVRVEAGTSYPHPVDASAPTFEAIYQHLVYTTVLVADEWRDWRANNYRNLRNTNIVAGPQPISITAVAVPFLPPPPSRQASERAVQLRAVHRGTVPKPRGVLQVGDGGAADGRRERGGEGARRSQAFRACGRQHGEQKT